MEVIFEILAEFVLQFVFEAVASVFGRKSDDGKELHPAYKLFGYATFGAIAGGLSLLVMSSSFVSAPGLKILSLIVTPVLAGLAMAWVGKWRESHGKKRSPLDRFAYGYVFALTMALVRFTFAK
jgi:hypothetical protein